MVKAAETRPTTFSPLRQPPMRAEIASKASPLERRLMTPPALLPHLTRRPCLIFCIISDNTGGKRMDQQRFGDAGVNDEQG